MATNKSLVKLGQDDLEIVEETLSTPGWSLVIKVIEQLVRRRGEDVLTINDESLIKARSEYNGAKAILSDIKRLKEILAL